jgi:manganese/zinc/iron transport system permease protein
VRLRIRIVREHLLRALYEKSEPYLPSRPYITESELVAGRSWSAWLVRWWLAGLHARGWVERDRDRVKLTASGLAAAADVTRTHRLWELFLVESAGIASDHVDRDADDVEHMLPAPLIRDLERRLAASGRLPLVPQTVPESPHELL